MEKKTAQDTTRPYMTKNLHWKRWQWDRIEAAAARLGDMVGMPGSIGTPDLIRQAVMDRCDQILGARAADAASDDETLPEDDDQ